MSEWIVAIATAVQVVVTIVLVILTGWYASTLKKQVGQDRDLFDRKFKETAALVERQAKEYAVRQRERTEQAIRIIIAELEINSHQGEWGHQKSPPLLDSAFTVICGPFFRLE